MLAGAKTVTPPPNRHLTSLSARAIVLAVHPPMTLFARTILITAALVALTAGAAESQVALPKSSPFMPPGSAAAGVTAANETLEFAGVSVLGKRPISFSTTRRPGRHWIGIGETKKASRAQYDAAANRRREDQRPRKSFAP